MDPGFHGNRDDESWGISSPLKGQNEVSWNWL